MSGKEGSSVVDNNTGQRGNDAAQRPVVRRKTKLKKTNGG